MPRVSIIVPTHNHAHFLPECLASIKAQTYCDYEVIVVDNGSTDNTQEVIRNLSWDKLRYHYQDNTGSVAGPRNSGIRLAKGEYVAFLDSDDLWCERKLEKTMQVLETNPAIDILSHDLLCRREGKKLKIFKVGPLRDNMFEFLLIDNRLLGSATVAKRRVMEEIGGFDPQPEFVHAEDYDAWLKAAYLKKKFFFFNEALGVYRVHRQNLSLSFDSVCAHEKNVVDKHFKNYKSRIPLRRALLYRNRVCLICSKLAVQYFFRRCYGVSLLNLLRGFWLNPLAVFRNIFRLLFL